MLILDFTSFVFGECFILLPSRTGTEDTKLFFGKVTGLITTTFIPFVTLDWLDIVGPVTIFDFTAFWADDGLCSDPDFKDTGEEDFIGD